VPLITSAGEPMKATQTGMGVSWLKAVGMLYPKEKRLFEDPFSEKLLPPLYKFFLLLMKSPKMFKALMAWREKATPGLVGWQFCRFRYIDDVLRDAIVKKEVNSVVNLGAGMDCRAYYIEEVDNISYYEVDHPAVIKQKKLKMKKILGKLPAHVIYVPVDFENQSLHTELEKAQYDLNSKTLFIWEGVTQYITEEANDAILKYVAQAVPGSMLVFTYITNSFIEGKGIHDGIKVMYKYMRKEKNPLWIFGLEPTELTEYLKKYSLSLMEDIGSEEMMERYMKAIDIGLSVFEIERIALTEVKK
jgi:methyltransferase (TIGR00027 family)